MNYNIFILINLSISIYESLRLHYVYIQQLNKLASLSQRSKFYFMINIYNDLYNGLNLMNISLSKLRKFALTCKLYV